MEANFSRILIFFIEKYDDWRIWMQAHLSTLNDEIWTVIEDIPIKIMKSTIGEGGLVEKPRVEYTANDKKRANIAMLQKTFYSRRWTKPCSAKSKLAKLLKKYGKDNHDLRKI